MNQHAKIKNAAPTSVTTGPIRGSGKVYAAPKGRSDIRVLIRRRRAPFHGLYRAYGQRSAPVASTRERRHLAMLPRERQGAFDS